MPPLDCYIDLACFGHFWQGLLIGLALAIPIGPIALVCIQYAIDKGFTTALAAGFGAALADACFGIIAVLGITLLTDWLEINSYWIQIGGGIFLCALGCLFYFTHIRPVLVITNGMTYLTALTSTFLLTLANPMTIVACLALFGYFGLGEVAHDSTQAAITIAGVFVGSLLWWMFLAYGTVQLRHHFNKKTLMRFRQTGGVILFSFGLIALLRMW